MKKHIALGIAAAVIGASGVASALVSVDQITSLGASESGVSAKHDKLAANCWTITGATSDASCTASVAGLEVPALPGAADVVDGVDIPDPTGLLAMAGGAVDAAKGAVSEVQGLASGAVPTATGIVDDADPDACGIEVPVPVDLPLPTGIFSAGLNLFHMAQSLAMNDLGVAGVDSPVSLPVALPMSADDVINRLEAEVGCLAAGGGASPVPAVCTVKAGIPAAVTTALPGAVTTAVPAEVTGLLTAAVGDLADISGQGVALADGGQVGVSCNIDGFLAEMPIPGLESLPGLPALPSPTAVLPVVPAAPGLPALPAVPGLPAVPDAVGMVTGVVDTVTGAVHGILGGDLPVDVPPLPLPTGTPECSASGSGSIGGLLGSLTATISGGCR